MLIPIIRPDILFNGAHDLHPDLHKNGRKARKTGIIIYRRLRDIEAVCKRIQGLFDWIKLLWTR